LLASPATGFDLDAHTVSSGSDTIGFDKLLVATGSSPRRLPLADDSGAPVAYLRTIEDSRRLRERLRPERRLVVG
jgi:3-phenylpropionate/trans-cinnamate dioxygenase ferredoxin reductase component